MIETIDDLLMKANKNELTGCMISKYARDKNGYTRLYYKGRYVRAHRLAYELKFGQFNLDLKVCHKCDTPACMNPDHLFIGTHNDNMIDMVTKGRSGKGERHSRVKLERYQVIEIRESKEICKVLAERYNVSWQTISDIKRGATWKCLL